jgi:hypothetical protein
MSMTETYATKDMKGKINSSNRPKTADSGKRTTVREGFLLKLMTHHWS